MDHRPPSIKVDKPWGKFEQYTHNLTSTVKIITVTPGGALSSQYHQKRDELWAVLDRGAHVELDGEVVDPEAGEELYIPRGTLHRLSATGTSPCGYWRSPSASSTRGTSSAWTTPMAASCGDGPVLGRP